MSKLATLEAVARQLFSKYTAVIRTAVEKMSGDVEDHLEDKANPHAVTKAQVGLGSVQNYGVATKAEAEAGTATNKYMTPLRTKEAIDSAQTALAVNEFITVAADSLKQYDLQTLLGAGYVNFDLKTAEISVRAKDTNGSSPMFNSYANAEALVSYGIRDNRYVLIANQSGGPIDLYVKILVHPI